MFVEPSDCLGTASLAAHPSLAYRVELSSPVIIAISQTVAIYEGEVCLGGAQILRRGPSVYERERQRWGATHVSEQRCYTPEEGAEVGVETQISDARRSRAQGVVAGA